MCIYIYTVYIYVYIYILEQYDIFVISQRFTKHIKNIHHNYQHSENHIFAHFALPYDLLGFSSPFFRSCSALAFRLLSKACSWFCGLAKVTATFLVWIWDPRTVNELDIVRGLASFSGFIYGASFERLKNTMVIFSPKCWVALPEDVF